ncbi:MAG TPA: YerC/YecD family TrpR-related protein [Patescibacteria group bacterium]|nr:YerC/YecD family TrpR-related protein [Patescibacteria group bacterium]
MQWDNSRSDALFRAILELKNLEETKRFFRDLLTDEEVVEFSKRWQVAQMLDAEMPYIEIQRKTRLSSTTIARISKWLKSGMGGYRLMLDRISHHGHTFPSRVKERPI